MAQSTRLYPSAHFHANTPPLEPSITLNNRTKHPFLFNLLVSECECSVLQKKGQDHLLSWMETLKNTANATQWTMTCKCASRQYSQSKVMAGWHYFCFSQRRSHRRSYCAPEGWGQGVGFRESTCYPQWSGLELYARYLICIVFNRQSASVYILPFKDEHYLLDHYRWGRINEWLRITKRRVRNFQACASVGFFSQANLMEWQCCEEKQVTFDTKRGWSTAGLCLMRRFEWTQGECVVPHCTVVWKVKVPRQARECRFDWMDGQCRLLPNVVSTLNTLIGTTGKIFACHSIAHQPPIQSRRFFNIPGPNNSPTVMDFFSYLVIY